MIWLLGLRLMNDEAQQTRRPSGQTNDSGYAVTDE